MQIAKNTVVSIDYVLKDDDGQLLDSSEGREPMQLDTVELIMELEAEFDTTFDDEDDDGKLPPMAFA